MNYYSEFNGFDMPLAIRSIIHSIIIQSPFADGLCHVYYLRCRTSNVAPSTKCTWHATTWSVLVDQVIRWQRGPKAMCLWFQLWHRMHWVWIPHTSPFISTDGRNVAAPFDPSPFTSKWTAKSSGPQVNFFTPFQAMELIQSKHNLNTFTLKP